MNQIINSPTEIKNKNGWTVFLAGPMHSSPRGWRNKLVKAAGEMGMENITFLSPRYTTMRMPSNQVQWETQGLRMCDVAMFWIPNKDPKAELGTRVYAETTKMELAENFARGKKIILGIDTEINGTTHMKFLAKRYGIKKVHTSMEGCLEELKEWIEKSEPKVHHIIAPKFDSKEQLAAHPEFVDLLAMNQTLMERWNRIVAPEDKVYVHGELGNEEWMKLVNGDIQIVNNDPEGLPKGIRLI
jgi:hypothetical protein